MSSNDAGARAASGDGGEWLQAMTWRWRVVARGGRPAWVDGGWARLEADCVARDGGEGGGMLVEPR